MREDTSWRLLKSTCISLFAILDISQRRRDIRFLVLIGEDSESRTICRCNHKGSALSQVILRHLKCWSRRLSNSRQLCLFCFSSSEIGEHEQCHLGFNPAHAVVTREGNADIDNIITILEKMSEKYGVTQTNATQFQLFNSTRYSSRNLMFKDSATGLIGIQKDKRTYVKFLGEDYEDFKALTACSFLSTTQPTSSVEGAPYVSFLLVSLSALLTMIST